MKLIERPADLTLYTVAETSRLLRISRWTFYRLVNDRQLQTITIGRRRLVTAAAIQAYLERLQGSTR